MDRALERQIQEIFPAVRRWIRKWPQGDLNAQAQIFNSISKLDPSLREPFAGEFEHAKVVLNQDEKKSMFVCAEKGLLHSLKSLPSLQGDRASEVLSQARGELNTTLAHVAARRGQVDVFRFIAKKAKDTLKEKNFSGETPAHLAADMGHSEVLAVILEKDPSALEAKTNYGGETPVHILANRGDTDFLKVVIERAPDLLKVRDQYGSTPAHSAAKGNQIEVLRLIGNQATDLLKVKDVGGSTPAHVAAEFRHFEAVKLILEKAPEILKEETAGVTLADRVASAGRLEDFKFIAMYSPDSLKTRILEGRTPAYSAADSGHWKIVRYMLQNFKDPSLYLEPPGNKSLLQMAKGAGKDDIVQLLWDIGIKE